MIAPCGAGTAATAPHRAGPRRREPTMARRSRPRLSDAERERRRQADRERLEQAARDLLSSEGWARWIRVRATNGLARYSLRNQLADCPGVRDARDYPDLRR